MAVELALGCAQLKVAEEPLRSGDAGEAREDPATIVSLSTGNTKKMELTTPPPPTLPPSPE